MVRIIYRWRLLADNESSFRQAWAKATKTIRETWPGARGSFLLKSHQDPAEFLTIARWDSLEQWRAFWDSGGRTEMREVHACAQRLSEAVYEELEDHTV